MTTRRPADVGPTSSQLCKGLWPVGHGRADEAGPSLAQDVEEASAENGRAIKRS